MSSQVLCPGYPLLLAHPCVGWCWSHSGTGVIDCPLCLFCLAFFQSFTILLFFPLPLLLPLLLLLPLFLLLLDSLLHPSQVPLQPNSSDCGVYLLHFVQELFEVTPQFHMCVCVCVHTFVCLGVSVFVCEYGCVWVGGWVLVDVPFMSFELVFIGSSTIQVVVHVSWLLCTSCYPTHTNRAPLSPLTLVLYTYWMSLLCCLPP